MKIAVNAWFYDSVQVGSGQYVRNLLSAMRDIAPDVELELVRPRSRGNISKVRFEQVEFPRAAAKMNAHLAFVPYWAPPMQAALPVVVTIHDVIPLLLPAYRGRAIHRAYTSLVRAASPNAAAVITDSEHSKRDIVANLGVCESRVTAIPLAAESRFSPRVSADDEARARERYDLPESYAFYLGGFDPRKNIETLLQIYVWCGDTIGHEFPLVVSGRPDELAATSDGKRMTLSEMARKLEVDDAVRFIGRVSEEDKPALFAMARCFVFPSSYEGFGLDPLEAMSCGVPVVGSNAASLPEVVGDAGILVAPDNARQMAGAVIAVCTDDELHDTLRQRALLRAAKFSWQRTAFETLAVFRRAAKSQ